MKKLIRQYVAYNRWANERIAKKTLELTAEQFEREIVSSFPSIKYTLLHIWDAETIWLKRLAGHSLSGWPSAGFQGSAEELCNGLIAKSTEFETLFGKSIGRFSER